MRLATATSVLIVAGLLLGGCDTRSRRASARLRTENDDLKQKIDALTARQQELEATLADVEVNQGAQTGTLVDAPRLTMLAVAPLSGYEPGDQPRLDIHLTPTDGRRRPIQLHGPIEAQVLRPRPGDQPEVVATRTLTANEVRDAWRGGLFGTSYLVDVPIEAPSADVDGWVVHIFHRDLRTDRTLEATGTIAHHPSTGSP